MLPRGLPSFYIKKNQPGGSWSLRSVRRAYLWATNRDELLFSLLFNRKRNTSVSFEMLRVRNMLDKQQDMFAALIGAVDQLVGQELLPSPQPQETAWDKYREPELHDTGFSRLLPESKLVECFFINPLCLKYLS